MTNSTDHNVFGFGFAWFFVISHSFPFDVIGNWNEKLKLIHTVLIHGIGNSDSIEAALKCLIYLSRIYNITVLHIFIVVLITVAGWYCTRPPMHCDHL